MAAGIGEAASIAGIISLAGQAVQAVTTIATFCNAYKSVHQDITRASRDLEILRRVLLQVETTATFALLPSRCPRDLLSHLRDCISACRKDLHEWNDWSRKVDLDCAGRLEKIWKKVKIAADKSHFSKLSSGVSTHIEGIILCCQLLNCDLNVQTLHHAQHLTTSVTELKANQDDFRHNALDEISRMSDAMQKVKISNDQGFKNLHVGIDSIVNTSNAAISQQYQSLLEHIRVEFQNQFMAIGGQLDTYRKAIQGVHTMNSSARLDTAQWLTESQLKQVLGVLVTNIKIDHTAGLKSLSYGRRSRHKAGNIAAQHLYHSHGLQKWTSSDGSRLVLIQSSYSTRFSVRDFSVDIIRTLQAAKIPTLWALKSPMRDGHSVSLSNVDILRSLIYQALYLNSSLHAENYIAAKIAAVRDAVGSGAMFDILGSVLDGMRQVYIIVDVELLNSLEEKAASSSAFLDLFRKLADHGSTTMVKVAIMSYTANAFMKMHNESLRNLVDRAYAPAEAMHKKQISRKSLHNVDINQRRGIDRNQQMHKLLPRGSKESSTSKFGVVYGQP